MNLRKSMKNYPYLKSNLSQLKRERARCFDLDSKLEIDNAIRDLEVQLDTILTQIACVEDDQSKTVMLAHFVEGRTIQEIGRVMCYSDEWVYKKIAKGIDEIRTKEKGTND